MYDFDAGLPSEQLPDGIWQQAYGRYRVIVDGRDHGVWSKKRWARQQFRYSLRDKRAES